MNTYKSIYLQEKETNQFAMVRVRLLSFVFTGKRKKFYCTGPTKYAAYVLKCEIHAAGGGTTL